MLIIEGNNNQRIRYNCLKHSWENISKNNNLPSDVPLADAGTAKEFTFATKMTT